MADTTNDTASSEGTEPAADTTSAAASAPANDELASLKSRNSGLNAANTDLRKQVEALQSDLANARKANEDKEAGDADLRKQLADTQAALEAQTKQAHLANLKASYPEAASLLGDAIVGMSTDVLAATEARLKGAGDSEPETTTPPTLSNQQARGQSGAKNIEDMSVAELKAEMAKLTPEDMGLVPS